MRSIKKPRNKSHSIHFFLFNSDFHSLNLYYNILFSQPFRDICGSEKRIQGKILVLLRQLSSGYSDIYDEQRKSENLKQFKKEEFFGLRDFYRYVYKKNIL